MYDVRKIFGLQLALNYCDYMVESYDVLVALVETEAGILAASASSSEAASSSSSRQALSNRKSAEVVARHLVARKVDFWILP